MCFVDEDAGLLGELGPFGEVGRADAGLEEPVGDHDLLACPRYVSTSATEWAARRFSVGLDGAVLQLAVPAGANAAWMALVGVEEYRNQAELLLPHLTQVTLVGTERGSTRQPLIDCEIHG